MRNTILLATLVLGMLALGARAHAQTPPAPPAPGAATVTAAEVHIGTGVTNHAIDGEAASFSKAATHRIFILVKLVNPTGAEGDVVVAVERPGQTGHGGGVTLHYPTTRRHTTYARIPISNRAAGHYRAVVRSGNTELGAVEFDVTE